MKEETKKTRKPTTKKTTTKRVTKPKTETKKTIGLNELNKEVPGVTKDVVIKDESQVECIYCHKKFEKGYTICPHCHKRQNNGLGITFVIIFAILFILGIIIFHFVDKYVTNNTGEEYITSCVLVDYENLVRHPKEYRNKDVRVIGEIVEVEGYDTGYGNDMIITINANLFENSSENLITITYKDKNYEQGFIEGDMITAYGVYDAINGNIPNIKAKVITYGK